MIRRMRPWLTLLLMALLLYCVPMLPIRCTAWVVDCYLGAIQHPVHADNTVVLGLDYHGNLMQTEHRIVDIGPDELRTMFLSHATAQPGEAQGIQIQVSGWEDLGPRITLGQVIGAIHRIRQAAADTGTTVEITFHLWPLEKARTGGVAPDWFKELAVRKASR